MLSRYLAGSEALVLLNEALFVDQLPQQFGFHGRPLPLPQNQDVCGRSPPQSKNRKEGIPLPLIILLSNRGKQIDK